MVSRPERGRPTVAIIGGGPAGLMAAETISEQGYPVDIYDGMPSVGRKFLLAGVGGLNITHSEPFEHFLTRYGPRQADMTPWLEAFSPERLRQWVHQLGIDTFVGSSGRVFPTQMKAAPLLRAWLHRLRQGGVQLHVRHRWLGWHPQGGLRLATPDGERLAAPAATVLALGGASWPRLGSDGQWVTLLQQPGVPLAPLQPANCGFDIDWSEHFRERFAGQPLKTVAITLPNHAGEPARRLGECVISRHGIEGSLIYALARSLRETINQTGSATLWLDLAPDRDISWLATELSRPRGSRSLSSHLQSRTGIKGVKAGLLREALPAETLSDPRQLAAGIKQLPLRLRSPRPLDEAISTAGGVCFEALDEWLMLRARPGVFCAGEMLDWEAPTGGYLLTGCLASGRAAGRGVLDWLARQPE